jgi:hypothetical protein
VHEGGYTIAGNPTGGLTFHRPDGRPIPERPVGRTGSTQALTQRNHRRGIHPGPTSITPAWTGDGLDTDWAVTVLVNNMIDHRTQLSSRAPQPSTCSPR